MSTELVREAQQGRGKSMDELARQAERNVRIYIYRLTLDHDLTQELSQEVFLQMVKSLKCLRKAESFRPWLYRIARNKVRQHYRDKRRESSIVESAAYSGLRSSDGHCHRLDGPRRLTGRELSSKIMGAMRQLAADHRAVLSLRCFEQFSYSAISTAMNCSEGSARVMFHRAKQALKAEIIHSI